MKKDYFNTFEESDFCIHEDLELSVDNQHITALVETLFDVDKKFGINVSQSEDAWVNLYACYNPVTESLKAFYYIYTYNGNFERKYIPTDDEKKIFVNVMEQACIKQNKMNCREFYIREYAAYADKMSLACVQNGDSCQVINTDDGFVLYCEDMTDGSLKNHLGHNIELANYGDGECLSIECVDCYEVLYSTDTDCAKLDIDDENQEPQMEM
ncbi:MAG: hypothetical protein Q4C12_05830 [Clostridia bacterium]|nr:hypothetical protein [Clostridia bacterium]